MLRTLSRFVVVSAIEGLVGFIAVESVKGVAAEETVKGYVLLAIWPLVIVAGTIAFAVWVWRADQKPAPNAVEPTEAAVIPEHAAKKPEQADDRLGPALDELIASSYDPDRHLVLDMHRRAVMQRLGIGDLFIPDPEQGRLAFDRLAERANVLRERYAVMTRDRTDASISDWERWKREVEPVLEIYVPHRLAGFRDDQTSGSRLVERVAALRSEVR